MTPGPCPSCHRPAAVWPRDRRRSCLACQAHMIDQRPYVLCRCGDLRLRGQAVCAECAAEEIPGQFRARPSAPAGRRGPANRRRAERLALLLWTAPLVLACLGGQAGSPWVPLILLPLAGALQVVLMEAVGGQDRLAAALRRRLS